MMIESGRILATATLLAAISGIYLPSPSMAQSSDDSWRLDSIEIKKTYLGYHPNQKIETVSADTRTLQSAAARIVPAQSGLAPLTGQWFGSYKNDKGESGTSMISLVEGANGVITGDEAGWKIKNGRRVGNVVTWQYLKQVRRCRDYQVRLELSNDGKVLSGTYTVKDRCAGPANYSGQYLKYQRE